MNPLLSPFVSPVVSDTDESYSPPPSPVARGTPWRLSTPTKPPRTPSGTRVLSPKTPTRSSARLSVKKSRYPAFPLEDYLTPMFSVKIANRAGPYRFSGAEEVFRTPELIAMILAYCDWHVIQNVSRTSFYGRHAAQMAAKEVIRNTIRPFVPGPDFSSFMVMLDETGAGIAGSVARRVLSSNSAMVQDAIEYNDERYLRSADLNIIAPRGKSKAVIEWFTKHQYDYWTKTKPARAYQSSVLSFTSGSRDAKDTIKAAKLTISESVGNVLQVTLASTLTCQTNLITSTRVYAVYPTLITNRSALRTDITNAVAPRRTRASYVLETTNSRWTGPCGVHCPSLVRRTVGDQGIASFYWNPNFTIPSSRYQFTDSLLAQSVLQWRFAKRCSNPKCSRFIPPTTRVF
ncbi:hypothetical protein DFP72DRAFT_355824 [Ephemerocybe angulata]|uniref:Uncharacterized protein n=1 Tax=Ephemerocybe angulata TaxID=980116 RepID=A0A8H6HZ65_9AGAR|nr:hypothetical protein DFP72DRAFT_355824 [Tulosesus angulatus]